jgi:hypothetical protein
LLSSLPVDLGFGCIFGGNGSADDVEEELSAKGRAQKVNPAAAGLAQLATGTSLLFHLFLVHP